VSGKEGITGILPEPMPAIHVPLPSLSEPAPESEVMPLIKVPSVSEEPTKAITATAPLIPPKPVLAVKQAAEPCSKPASTAIDQDRAESEKLIPEKAELKPVVMNAPGLPPSNEQSEPALVSSIPGPLIIATSVAAEKPPVADETIEIEPRITIHEKTAEITIDAIDTNTATQPEPPAITQEQAHLSNEKVDARSPISDKATSSPRLTNLKDLFKGSRARIEPSKDIELGTGTEFGDTVELEPGLTSMGLGASRGTDESKLVSFASLKELDSYKYSIHALVEKYLQYKLDREIPDTSDDESLPVVIEDETFTSRENVPFSEADLSPHEAASVGKTDVTENAKDATGVDSVSEPEAPGAEIKNGTVVEPGEAQVQRAGPRTPAAPASAIQSTGKVLGNFAGSQQPLVEMLSVISMNLPYRVDIDIMAHINASIMARARSSKLMRVRGEILAQIINLETYTALVRLNRTIGTLKSSRVNTAMLRSTEQAIKEIEAYAQPVKSYRPENIIEAESTDVEKQLGQISSGRQYGMTDDELAKFLAYIKEVGDGQAMMVAGGDDAPLKAAMSKIKRVALDLYNNTQYEQAIQIYSAFVDFFPEDFEALFNLGFCYRELGNYKDSEIMFKRIIELFYDNAYAWYNLSVIYSLTTEGDKEAYCLQRAREFGYVVDITRLSRLLVTYTPKNPFDA